MKKQLIEFSSRGPVIHGSNGKVSAGPVRAGVFTGNGLVRTLSGGVVDLGAAEYRPGAATLTPEDLDNLVIIANGITADTLKYTRKRRSNDRLVGVRSTGRKADIALVDTVKKALGRGVARYRFSDNTSDLGKAGSDNVNFKNHLVLEDTRQRFDELIAAIRAVCALAAFVNAHRESYTVDPAYAKGARAYGATGKNDSGTASVTVTYLVPFNRAAYGAGLDVQRRQEEHEAAVADLNAREAAGNNAAATHDRESAALRLEEAADRAETLKLQTSTGMRRVLTWIGVGALLLSLGIAVAVVVKKTKKR